MLFSEVRASSHTLTHEAPSSDRDGENFAREFVNTISFEIREKTKYRSWIREFLYIRELWFVNGQNHVRETSHSSVVHEFVNQTPLGLYAVCSVCSKYSTGKAPFKLKLLITTIFSWKFLVLLIFDVKSSTIAISYTSYWKSNVACGVNQSTFLEYSYCAKLPWFLKKGLYVAIIFWER